MIIFVLKSYEFEKKIHNGSNIMSSCFFCDLLKKALNDLIGKKKNQIENQNISEAQDSNLSSYEIRK